MLKIVRSFYAIPIANWVLAGYWRRLRKRENDSATFWGDSTVSYWWQRFHSQKKEDRPQNSHVWRQKIGEHPKEIGCHKYTRHRRSKSVHCRWKSDSFHKSKRSAPCTASCVIVICSIPVQASIAANTYIVSGPNENKRKCDFFSVPLIAPFV